jgi:hypothetical protein
MKNSERFKMARRSQITLFIITGMLILILVGLFYYLLIYQNGKSISSTLISPHMIESKESVNKYIYSGLKTASIKSIKITLTQGGVYSPVDYVTYTYAGNEYKVNYGLKNDINLLSAIEIDKEICKGILNTLPGILDFSFLEKSGMHYNVFIPDAKCSAILTESTTLVHLYMPIEVNYSGESYTLSDYSAEIAIGLPSIIIDSSTIIDHIIGTDTPEVNYDLTKEDYSCHSTRACYLGDSIVQVRKYTPFENEPALLFFVAVDKVPMLRCSSFDNINGINGGACA